MKIFAPRRRKAAFKLLLLTLAISALLGLPAYAHAFRILIDPGHDRVSPSVSGCKSGIPEYVFNNKLSAAIIARLKKNPRYAVGITHPPQGIIGLHARAQATQDYDLFVSIHHDSAQARYFKPMWIGHTKKKYAKGVRGFCVFVSDRNMHAGESIRFAKILAKNMIKQGFRPSRHHGADIPLERHVMIAPGVYYYNNLIVLRKAHTPAVLLEAAVLTNPRDEDLASRPDFRRKVAAAVDSSLKTYLGKASKK